MPKIEELPKVTPKELIEILEYLDTLNNPPALMIYGVPGIGKSTIVRDFANRKHYELRIKHLSRMDPTDWSGIPNQNPNDEYTSFKPLALFKPPKEGYKKIVIFFDELNTALPQVLNSALDVILEKRGDIETHGEKAQLPQETIIVAAGNLGPELDGTVVEEFSSAVKTRLIQVYLETNFNDWKAWAEENKIEEIVINFLNENQEYLIDIEGFKQNLQQIATPRGWERVSNYIKSLDKYIQQQNYSVSPEELLEKLVIGTVGKKAGEAFMEYYKNFKSKTEDLYKTFNELISVFQNPNVKEIGNIGYYINKTKEIFKLVNYSMNSMRNNSDLLNLTTELLKIMYNNFLGNENISVEAMRPLAKFINKDFIDFVINRLGLTEYKKFFARMGGTL
jgi:MoxR-like ATPase